MNDTRGHSEGDKVLQKVAQILQGREHDVVARWGGDEFVILLNCTKDAIIVAHRYRELILDITDDDGKRYGIGASIGIVEIPHKEIGKGIHFVTQADDAMYAVKNSGKNGVCIWINGKVYTIDPPKEK